MNKLERYSVDIHQELERRAQMQVASSLEKMKKRLHGGRGALLWDWNNTLVDNFWVRLNKIRELFERRGGFEIEIFEDIYAQAEASITIAANKLDDYYRGIKIIPPEVNEIMERNEIENPIKDPRLPGIIQELGKAGFPSIGIITGSRQKQISTINSQIQKFFPDLNDIPVLLYPELDDFSHRKENPLPRNYKYTLIWKQIVAEQLQPLLDVPLFLVDNEPRQADLINTRNRNIIGVHFNDVAVIRQQIEQSIY